MRASEKLLVPVAAPSQALAHSHWKSELQGLCLVLRLAIPAQLLPEPS